MSEFEIQLQKLNTAQRQAVETTDGPLLVLAGPGTGKTTLLTTRIAYILNNTDTLPSGILCLTFTESAQKTMQSRLVKILGQDAYKVQIHTFHSFGAWVIRSYPHYFEEYITSTQADDVTSYQLLLSIFERLDHHDPLSSVNEGEYLYMSDVRTRISQLKQAAISPTELASICRTDSKWVTLANKAANISLENVATINKSSLASFEELLKDLEKGQDITKIGQLAFLELRDALDAAQSEAKVSTKPVTAWKNNWLVKGADGIFRFKYGSTLKRLQSLAKVYELYIQEMKSRNLTDFDDQLMLLLQAMRNIPDLLAEMQERFMYLMVDEFQDTNGVQQRILETIADNPVHNGQPNVMVVGDDDQAIYGFQGAYSSNVLDFLQRWTDVQTVILTENYRSTPEIVEFSRSVITQGKDRLEDSYEYIDKALSTPNKSGDKVISRIGISSVHAYQQLADAIQQNIASGVSPNEIAVLAPQHKYLERLVPYLSHYDIGVSYERRQDILHENHIYELTTLTEVVVALGEQRFSEANNSMPELLSYSWWGLPSETIWQISLDSYKRKTFWIDVMLTHDKEEVRAIASWLIKASQDALNKPLEQMLDQLIGYGQRHDQSIESYNSPYFDYYYLEQSTTQSLYHLITSLISLRQRMREYFGKEEASLSDFVSYIQLRKQSGLTLVNDHPLASKANAVHLMTAHKSKGLEFEVVYIINVQENVWGSPRGRSPLIAIPPHILAIQNGESSDENLRKFYVAITRASKQLTLVSTEYDDQNNPILPLRWLEAESVKANITTAEQSNQELSEADITRGVSFDWHLSATQPTDASWRERLTDRIQNYRLSPTHLGTFLDVTISGPRMFFANHLLRFPQGGNVNIDFGNAMHYTMQYLHNEILTKGSLPNINTTINTFNTAITEAGLNPAELPRQLTRGKRALEYIYQKGLPMFSEENQIAEVDFTQEDIHLQAARVTGKIDLIDYERGIIRDYKTGKPASAWPKHAAKSYEALKLHRYRQQLLFYKLIADASAGHESAGLTTAQLVFLESADHDSVQTLSFEYDTSELERTARLINAVWHKITALDLPNTDIYTQDITGIRQFEEDLLNGN